MKSQPIIAPPPAAQAKAPAPANNNAEPAVDPFVKVLARQRANATSLHDGKHTQNNKSASSAANEGTPKGNDAAGVLSSDVASTPAANAFTNSDKADTQATDAAGSLSSDMLTMLQPRTTVGEKVSKEALTGSTKGRLAAGAVAAVQRQDNIASSVQLDTRGKGKADATDAKAFTAVINGLNKGGDKIGHSDTGANPMSVQTAAPNSPDGILQSGITPVVGSQNNSSQTVQAAINTPLSHPAWGTDFSQKILWVTTQLDHTAELHLNPPNLGQLDVTIKVSGDQASALFSSPHAAVRDAVEQALPRLRDMMAENGIMLGNAMVSDQSSQQHQAWQASQQQGNRGAADNAVDIVSAESITSSNTTSVASRHLGMLDTFA